MSLPTLTEGHKRIVKFGVVGVSGVAVNLAFVWVGRRAFGGLGADLQDSLALGLGLLVSVFTNFLLNDRWTWGDRSKGGRKRDFLARMGAYYLATGVASALQYAVAAGLRNGFAWNTYMAALVGIAFGSVLNFVASHHWSFKDQPQRRGGSVDPPAPEGPSAR